MIPQTVSKHGIVLGAWSAPGTPNNPTKKDQAKPSRCRSTNHEGNNRTSLRGEIQSSCLNLALSNSRRPPGMNNNTSKPS